MWAARCRPYIFIGEAFCFPDDYRMLYEVKNGSLSLNGNNILSHIDFRLVDNEKIGIVGRNGSGKTTFLRFLNDEIGLDYNDDNTIGEVVKSNDFKIGYMKQSSTINDIETSSEKIILYDFLLESFKELIDIKNKIDEIIIKLEDTNLTDNEINTYSNRLNSLMDEFNNKDGNNIEKELNIGIKKFGFKEEDLKKYTSEFSGGEYSKLNLLKLLLSKPNVLVLDEPTNHLDVDAIIWMEDYLKKYRSNIILVSHDRMFLDNVCNIIYEVENKTMTRYIGNYSDYVENKKLNYEIELARFNKNEKEIERLTKLADRFRYKATKASMVKSKEKIIDKLSNNTFKPLESNNESFNYDLKVKNTGGKEVLNVSDLVVGYNKSNPVAKININLLRNDRLGIIGKNGTGKSTFLKTIVGDIDKVSGDFSFGYEIQYGYFDQNLARNNSDESLFDNFHNEYPDYTNEKVRNILGRFNFYDEDIIKKVKDLSGGEKVRLALAKIFEKRPNLLILDEPTNHLDILGKEALEDILLNYNGSIIFVSHDRYFMKKIATKILLFENNKTLRFDYGYDDYIKYINSNDNNFINDNTNYEAISTYLYEDIVDKNEKIDDNISKSKFDFNESKKNKSNEKKIKKLEDEIDTLENKKEELLKKMEDNSIQNNYEELMKIKNEVDEVDHKITELMNTWEELNK